MPGEGRHNGSTILAQIDTRKCPFITLEQRVVSMGNKSCAGLLGMVYGDFPKLGGTILGVFIMKTIVLGGLYCGPPILGNYHMTSV